MKIAARDMYAWSVFAFDKDSIHTLSPILQNLDEAEAWLQRNEDEAVEKEAKRLKNNYLKKGVAAFSIGGGCLLPLIRSANAPMTALQIAASSVVGVIIGGGAGLGLKYCFGDPLARNIAENKFRISFIRESRLKLKIQILARELLKMQIQSHRCDTEEIDQLFLAKTFFERVYRHSSGVDLQFSLGDLIS